MKVMIQPEVRLPYKINYQERICVANEHPIFVRTMSIVSQNHRISRQIILNRRQIWSDEKQVNFRVGSQKVNTRQIGWQGPLNTPLLTTHIMFRDFLFETSHIQTAFIKTVIRGFSKLTMYEVWFTKYLTSVMLLQ